MSLALDYRERPVRKQIFNHDTAGCRSRHEQANHQMSARALGITEPGDLVQLHGDLRSHWDAIHSHYQRIGLVHTHEVIWNVGFGELSRHVGHSPSVYCFGSREFRNWGDHEWFATVDFIQSRNNFIRLAQQLNMPVPRTRCFEKAAEVEPSSIEATWYPCHLKSAQGDRAGSNFLCRGQEDLVRALAAFEASEPVQIQEHLHAEVFLELQYMAVGDDSYRVGASECVAGINGQCNVSVPASFEPWRVIEPMAQWLDRHGIKGAFAFTVAVVNEGSSMRFPVIACNPGFSETSYPALVAQKLGIRQWSAIEFSTRYRRLSSLDFAGIEYNSATREGVVVVNWGTMEEGQLGLLLAGSRATQTALLDELRKRW